MSKGPNSVVFNINLSNPSENYDTEDLTRFIEW